MKIIKNSLFALFFALGSITALAQTSNPATTKPNQNTPPATTATPTTDRSVSTNSNTPTRTDSVVTIPKEGTSITTAPGDKEEKRRPKTTSAKNKKTKP